jgi:recombination protein RecT|tara:strand:- start:18124 stop:19041 length:918 start_codon:yes stop_codon:yes gene_type:complete
MAQTSQQQLISNFSATISKYEHKNLAELLETHNITPSQFKNIVINEVKKSEKMQQAFLNNPASLFASILLCAELGLNPSADVGEFYFLPFGSKITPILGYKGVINLILRSGEISKLWSEIVYQDDEFEYELGLEPKLVHKPNHERTNKNIKYVYAVAKLTNGETMFKVMSKKEIMEIVEMSKYPNSLYGSNKDPQGWMYKKTVIKQLSKTLPKDYYGKRGISVDDKVEGGGYLKLDDDNNIMFVEGKKIIPKRSKSIYSNLDIDVEPLEISNIEVIEPQEIVPKKKKSKKESLTLDFNKAQTSAS